MKRQKITQYSYRLKKERRNNFIAVFTFFIFLFAIVNLIINFLIFPVKQNSPSMNPDVPENSFVMVSPFFKNIERGDIVLVKPRVQKDLSFARKTLDIFAGFFTGRQFFSAENENLPGTKPSLRRAVGMPGDAIYMRDYVLYVLPQGEKHFLTEFEIAPKTYNVTFFSAPAGWENSLGAQSSFERIVLGKDEYFVLGDNRKTSDDSRLWGVIKKERIGAKAMFCYFPFKSFKIY